MLQPPTGLRVPPASRKKVTDRKPNSIDSAMLVPRETLQHRHTGMISRVGMLLMAMA